MSTLPSPRCPCILIDKHQVNVTYAAPADGGNTQLPKGTQGMIASYQVTGVAEFAKKMEEEGEFVVLLCLHTSCCCLVELETTSESWPDS